MFGAANPSLINPLQMHGLAAMTGTGGERFVMRRPKIPDERFRTGIARNPQDHHRVAERIIADDSLNFIEVSEILRKTGRTRDLNS